MRRSSPERTRQDLGNTVEALRQKFDLTVQAQHKLHDATRRATEQTRAVRERAKDAATDEHGAVTATALREAAVAILNWRQRG